MEKKYNLALIPISKSDEIIKYARKFSNIADAYLLGEKSLPHVTLYQFKIEEQNVYRIWSQVCEICNEKTIDLTFEKFSYITFDNNIYWISLLPDKEDALYNMHCLIANAIGLPIKTNFDPHMTLINTKNKESESEIDNLSSSYSPITDTFALSLGKSDDIGQFTEIVYCCVNKEEHGL